MWCLSPRARRRPAAPQARLHLECLEGRAIPSALSLARPDAAAAVFGSAAGRASAMPAAPVITGFQVASAGYTNWYTFSGTVSGYLPGMVVSLSGLPQLQGVQVGVNSSGQFSLTVQLSSGESGTVTAVATDTYGQVSNAASVFVDVVLTYSKSSGNNV